MRSATAIHFLIIGTHGLEIAVRCRKLYAGCGGVSRGAVDQVEVITAKLEGITPPVH